MEYTVQRFIANVKKTIASAKYLRDAIMIYAKKTTVTKSGRFYPAAFGVRGFHDACRLLAWQIKKTQFPFR